MKKEYVEVLLEEMRGQLSLVLEGHAALGNQIEQVRQESNQKHDHTAFLINTLNQKIDWVAADLTAHRADTEAHGGLYLVKEG